MFDIVYPLANLSKNKDDFELRFSLRSLAEQSWVGRIFLIGHKPSWIKDVEFIPAVDPYKPKDANIIQKILSACRIADISQRFIVNSDDQYFLKKVDPQWTYPRLEFPSSLRQCQNKVHGLWHRRVLHTLDFCRQENKPQWLFEAHIPYMVDKERYPEIMNALPWGEGNGLTTHVYFNFLLKETPERFPAEALCRCNSIPDFRKLNAKKDTCVFLNHNNAGLGEKLKEFLEQRFPNPSPWEAS